MREYVLDASVAAKWFLRIGEPLVTEARSLLDSFGSLEISFLVPDFFAVEMANVLWKAARWGRISAAEANEALEAITTLQMEIYDSSELLPLAFQIATKSGQTVDDSLYVALAARTSRELITADERLVNVLGTRYPVRWLGAFSA